MLLLIRPTVFPCCHIFRLMIIKLTRQLHFGVRTTSGCRWVMLFSLSVYSCHHSKPSLHIFSLFGDLWYEVNISLMLNKNVCGLPLCLIVICWPIFFFFFAFKVVSLDFLSALYKMSSTHWLESQKHSQTDHDITCLISSCLILS